MQLCTLLEDDEGVSPVIGVILMVAITVILAAVIGTFVLGLGDTVSSTAPAASFEFNYESGGSGDCSGLGGSDAVEIVHKSGDEIPADKVTISDGSNTETWTSCDSDTPTDITAGATADVEIDADDTVRILWENDDDSATLSVWDAPGA